MQLTAKQLARMIDSTNIGTLATKQGIDEMIEQAKEYEDKANFLRKAQHGRVDPYGFLYGVCGIPNNNKTGISSNGQSFFLMMEAAYHDLYENPVNDPNAWYNSMFKDDNAKSSDYMDIIRQ